MKKILAMALNDDIEEATFFTEDGQYFFDYGSFIQFLTTPHTEDYYIRYVSLLDIPKDSIKAIEAFNVLDMQGPTSEKFSESLNLLWTFGKENGFF